MAIRFVDKSGRRAWLSPTLQDAGLTAPGTHVAPRSCVATLGAQLADAATDVRGTAVTNADRAGTLTAPLGAATAQLAGTFRAAAQRTGTIITVLADYTDSFSGTVQGVQSAQFAPASGFSITAQYGADNGDFITVGAPPGTFGVKPFDPRPLIWAPMDTQFNPSSLGRITSWLGNPLGPGDLAWSATGGPSGAGCLAGKPSPGGTGENNWAQGFDLRQWSGWATAGPYGNGYFVNDFGQRSYTYRKIYRNFGHLDYAASRSYNGIGNYNTKIWRTWSAPTLMGQQGYPDFYYGPSNGIFVGESIPNTWGGFTDFPSGGGSQDWAGEVYAAIVSAESVVNKWFAEEVLTFSNSDAATADANFVWRVPAATTKGPFPLGAITTFPIQTYHLIDWQFLHAGCGQTISGQLRGSMVRVYPIHYIVDGAPGSGRPMAPVGAFLNVADVYHDDSLCRCIATDSPIWGAERDSEIQVPVTWSDTQVKISAHNLRVGLHLWFVDAANKQHYAGQRLT